MDIIHLLPDSVANQIAAGEVIQRPASIVKELVENSLDAGATHITLIIQDAGRTLVQVIDNGKGMSETDVRMAFERHATSKIQSAADLFNLHTMGFRGEALASIVAVAQVEVLTKRPEDEIGTKLEIAGSKVELQEPVQCPTGTSMKVKNLFYNVPARRRFLKTNTTEFRNILTEFYRIVLVNSQVGFTLVNDDEIVFDLPQQTEKQRIEAVLGRDKKKTFTSQLIDLKTETHLVNIHGFIGKPETASKNAQQYFFVNNRFMKHPYFHKAIQMAYQGMINADTAPTYFIYFDIDPNAIDINIHPTKTEIKFVDEQTIWQILHAAVKECLGKFDIAPSIDFNQQGAPSIPHIPSNNQDVKLPQPNFDRSYNPFNQSNGSYTPTIPKTNSRNWEKLYEDFNQSKLEPQQTTQQEDEIINVESELYQFKEHYILTPVKSGLMWIDQHRAHVCVLYNQYSHQLDTTQSASQQLLFPETIDLDASTAQLMITLLPSLKNIGYEIEQLGPFSFIINGVPSMLAQHSPLKTIQDILYQAQTTPNNTHDHYHHLIALEIAKATAINYGQKLSRDEMSELINNLFACKTHTHTPDGRTVIYLQQQNEIDNHFN